MRVISCMIILALLCTTFTGCSLFKKNTNGGAAPAVNGPAPPKFPGVNDPILNSNLGTPPPAFPPAPGPQSAANSKTTIFAGNVRDQYNRPVSNAFVRLVSADAKDTGAPVDVPTDVNGLFIIQGVKTGQTYKLIARTKVGEKMLAGESLRSAPDTKVLITIREDLVNSNTPPMPGAPAPPPEAGQGISMNTGDASKGWNLGAAAKTGQEPNLPATLNVPVVPPNNPAFVPNIVENPKDTLPMLQIPVKPAGPTIPNDPPRPILPPPGAKLDTGPARVPSCVLVGNHLENLALKDTKGQTWEYRKNAQGKLVLIDFWYMACPPCREAMPAVNRLHQQYGTRGLEVIGISVEQVTDERKQSDAINKFCTSMQVTYRQLLGRSGTFDAGKQFRVNSFPTLMLVSEQGDIIWHRIGLDAGDASELERLIQSRLAKTF